MMIPINNDHCSTISADLVTFTEEIFYGKLNFLCSDGQNWFVICDLCQDPSKLIIMSFYIAESYLISKTTWTITSSIRVVTVDHGTLWLPYRRYLRSTFIKIFLENEDLTNSKSPYQKLLRWWRHQWVQSGLVMQWTSSEFWYCSDHYWKFITIGG